MLIQVTPQSGQRQLHRPVEPRLGVDLLAALLPEERRRSARLNETASASPAAVLRVKNLFDLHKVGAGAVVVHAARLESRAGMVARPSRNDAHRDDAVGGGRDLLAEHRALHDGREPRADTRRLQARERRAVPDEATVLQIPRERIGARRAQRRRALQCQCQRPALFPKEEVAALKKILELTPHLRAGGDRRAVRDEAGR
mmetsp:Transcript_38939/g.85594  ORF Transcript_38939/g.85594 Transcript_38939/m.85594 type:complete len:200 (-) Transcript_38939:341-940(-)